MTTPYRHRIQVLQEYHLPLHGGGNFYDPLRLCGVVTVHRNTVVAKFIDHCHDKYLPVLHQYDNQAPRHPRILNN